MSLFDQLVDEALRNTPDLGLLRPAVEKELLHHDILRELSDCGLLPQLTFMGGTCLRACYGSIRLSEDLGFYGGLQFDPQQRQGFSGHLQKALNEKYGLKVEVREPRISPGNVATWKVLIVTRPERPDFPAQRIHLDICALSALDPGPRVLRNPYGVEMGTTGLIVPSASREEILADKFVALALRRGRVKYRDLWDIQWLLQSTVSLPHSWVFEKAAQHGQTLAAFREKLRGRLEELKHLPNHQADFAAELGRFLFGESIRNRVLQKEFWQWILQLLREESAPLLSASR